LSSRRPPPLAGSYRASGLVPWRIPTAHEINPNVCKGSEGGRSAILRTGLYQESRSWFGLDSIWFDLAGLALAWRLMRNGNIGHGVERDVFAMAFVMVQFSAIAYSRRLVLWFMRDRMLFHALGAFTATFRPVHARLGGPRRIGKGPAILDVSRWDHDYRQHAPVCSVDAAPRRPSDRQRAASGRRPEARRDRPDVPPPDDKSAASRAPEAAADRAPLGRATQALKYFGKLRTIAKLDVCALVALAQQAGGTIVMACAVGNTLVEGAVLLRVHDGERRCPRARS